MYPFKFLTGVILALLLCGCQTAKNPREFDELEDMLRGLSVEPPKATTWISEKEAIKWRTYHETLKSIKETHIERLKQYAKDAVRVNHRCGLFITVDVMQLAQAVYYLTSGHLMLEERAQLHRVLFDEEYRTKLPGSEDSLYLSDVERQRAGLQNEPPPNIAGFAVSP